jgi:hypothetical protein
LYAWLTYVFFQDAILAVFLAIFFLCGMAPAASYSAQWGEPPTLCDFDAFSVSDELKEELGSRLTCDDQELTAELASLSVAGFLGMILTIFLIVWTIIAAITSWDHVAEATTTTE